MAATGKTPILLYGSTTSTNVPVAGNLTNSSDGCEIAINVADKNLFFKDSTNTVNTVPIRQSSASSNGWLSSTDWSTFNGKASSFTYTTNYIPYGQGTTTPAQSANLVFNGTNFGVGTSSPSYIIDAIGANAQSIRVGSSNGDLANLIMYSAGNASWSISSDVVMRFKKDSTEYGRFTQTGDFSLATGNLVIGTSGKGIDFSATAGTGTSELLADYEEGTWTPVVQGSTSAGTGTYNSQDGYYTKVGNIVYFQLWLQVSTHTGTGDTRITGLPFTSKNVFGNGGATLNYAANLNFTADYVVQIQVAQNATYMNLSQYVTGGGSGVTTIGIPVDSNMQVQISGFYLV